MRKKKNNRLKLNKFMIVLIISTMLLANVSLSRYKSTTTGNSMAFVALFNQKTTQDIVLTDIKPGDIRTYDLFVTNYEEDKTTEVTMQYYIDIVEKGQLPLEISILNKKDETEYELKERVEMQAGTKKKDEYILKIEWKVNEETKEEADYNYQNKIHYIKICFDSEQVD